MQAPLFFFFCPFFFRIALICPILFTSKNPCLLALLRTNERWSSLINTYTNWGGIRRKVTKRWRKRKEKEWTALLRWDINPNPINARLEWQHDGINRMKTKKKKKRKQRKKMWQTREYAWQIANNLVLIIQAHCVYLNKTRIEKQGTKLRMTIVKTACEASVPHPNSE